MVSHILQVFMSGSVRVLPNEGSPSPIKCLLWLKKCVECYEVTFLKPTSPLNKRLGRTL